jgi:hypothetical protein
MSTAVAFRRSILLGHPSQARDFAPLLRWMILISLTVFALLSLWQLSVIQTMFRTDRTHISSFILLLFAVTSLHCLVQTWFVSKELVATRIFRDALRRTSTNAMGGDVLGADALGLEHLPQGSLIAQHVANLLAKAQIQGGRRVDQGALLRVLANRLRGRERLGMFVSEALLRLALLGTAVGFILMLIPIAGLTSFDAETLRKALSGMSGGMAVALNITVAGIATALLLKLQYYFLTTAMTELFDMITEVTEVYVISALERD